MTISMMIGGSSDLPEGYLNSLPEHDANFATRILETLGFNNFDNRKPVKLIPDVQGTILGAYEKVFVLCDERVRKCFWQPHDDLLQKALSIFPGGTLFVIASKDSSNTFRYRFFENGTLIRDHGGNMDEGVTVDFGPPLPEEEPAFRNSRVIDGERIFFEARVGGSREIEEYTIDAYGETLGLKITQRFIGKRDPRHLSVVPASLNAEMFF
ncbi:hypothetical protein KF728_20490 [Candidatus Obscuribacterales bacterium]|nr:hypothetical protein [Candidatus Obscuribacterales bacterium]